MYGVLRLDWYRLTVTDALGCSASYSTIVPDSNDCVELFGSVFLDDNANCLQDGNDAGLANIPILLTSTTSGNTYWAYTDASGSYSIRVPEDNYDVETTWQYNSYYSPTCGASFYQTSCTIYSFRCLTARLWLSDRFFYGSRSIG